MANTKSAFKAARKSERLTVRNRAVSTRLKTLHKKFEAASKAGDKEAAAKGEEAMGSSLVPALGLIHANPGAVFETWSVLELLPVTTRFRLERGGGGGDGAGGRQE